MLDRRVRITLVSGSLGGGGAERNIVWLGGALAAAGHSIMLLTVRPDIPDFYRVPAGVTRVKAPSEAALPCRWHGWRCVQSRNRALGTAIQDTKPEAVVSFIDTLNISVLMSLKSTSIPVIVAERTDPRRHRIGLRWSTLRRIYYPTAAAVVVQTRSVAKWAETVRPRWQVATISNPVRSSPLDSGSRPPWFGPFNVVAVGRLSAEKGFDCLIDAFGLLAKQAPDWHLTIVGEGGRRAELTERASRYRLGNRVHFVGTVAEPQSILMHADLFVLSSRYEGFPNALCEAMSCGLAVVSFDCPSGPAEIIQDGVNGFLAPAGDTDALRDRMLTLMKDEGKRHRLGQQAKEVSRLYSEARILSQWEELLHSVIRRSGKADVQGLLEDSGRA
ncbi:glycosyltransferase family 4 protein [Sulfurifustis variabilis]|uniref:glycosyltransferase family 4 protein n=1 Tax=Sulfurifustis variabilis TaxID=1675686 RepID=UPI0011E4D04B